MQLLSKQMVVRSLMMVFAVMLVFSAFGVDEVQANDLRNRVQQGLDEGDAQSTVDNISGTLLGFIRGITIPLAVLFFCWGGYLLWFTGDDPQAKGRAKSKFALFFVMLFLVFWSERLLGWVLNMLDMTEFIQ